MQPGVGMLFQTGESLSVPLGGPGGMAGALILGGQEGSSKAPGSLLPGRGPRGRAWGSPRRRGEAGGGRCCRRGGLPRAVRGRERGRGRGRRRRAGVGAARHRSEQSPAAGGAARLAEGGRAAAGRSAGAPGGERGERRAPLGDFTPAGLPSPGVGG